MAGSISHLTDENGNFTFDLIDNLGDAHEACEECFAEIARLEALVKARDKQLHHMTNQYAEAAHDMSIQIDDALGQAADCAAALAEGWRLACEAIRLRAQRLTASQMAEPDPTHDEINCYMEGVDMAAAIAAELSDQGPPE